MLLCILSSFFDKYTKNIRHIIRDTTLVTSVDKEFELDSNLSISSDPSVITSIIKTIDNGKASIIRLRSVSDTDQEVQIDWKSKKPRSLLLCKVGEEKEGATGINNKVYIPAMSFITLRAEW